MGSSKVIEGKAPVSNGAGHRILCAWGAKGPLGYRSTRGQPIIFRGVFGGAAVANEVVAHYMGGRLV
ncbi:MAG TPA: hypothetical protein VK688_05910, partial [Gemmatimonadales bacterium]|nr:hypothetical protein [Gemmatimonadales bacterium]